MRNMQTGRVTEGGDEVIRGEGDHEYTKQCVGKIILQIQVDLAIFLFSVHIKSHCSNFSFTCFICL